jgi:DNA-binding transcriptional ArsR family regulator
VDDEATEVIAQFEEVVQSVSATVARTFPIITEIEDVEQEARLLVLSYAGYVPGGRLAGKLNNWIYIGHGDITQVKRLLSRQLRLDLLQRYGRESNKTQGTLSLDELPEVTHPLTEYDSRTLDMIDEALIRIAFPFLASRYLDKVSEHELARRTGISQSTISRRTSEEKTSYLVKKLTDAGLVVEGDESAFELFEAYGYVRKSGR